MSPSQSYGYRQFENIMSLGVLKVFDICVAVYPDPQIYSRKFFLLGSVFINSCDMCAITD